MIPLITPNPNPKGTKARSRNNPPNSFLLKLLKRKSGRNRGALKQQTEFLIQVVTVQEGTHPNVVGGYPTEIPNCLGN